MKGEEKNSFIWHRNTRGGLLGLTVFAVEKKGAEKEKKEENGG